MKLKKLHCTHSQLSNESTLDPIRWCLILDLFLTVKDHFIYYLHVYSLLITWHYPVLVTWYNVHRLGSHVRLHTCFTDCHVGCHMCRSTSGGQSEGLQRAFRYPGGSHVIWRHGHVVGIWKGAGMIGRSHGMSRDRSMGHVMWRRSGDDHIWASTGRLKTGVVLCTCATYTVSCYGNKHDY